ncbi:MAG: DUF896 domain-containing protein [bacterium]|nr:DUF896 domain-containing protein [bacterium]
MDRKKIERINEFARKVKSGKVLTPEELAERDALRKEYLAAIRANFKATLDSIEIKK